MTLKYTEDRRSAISGLKRVSRPGQRHYVDHDHLPKVLGGMGTAIVSTSHGVMTGHDARKAGVAMDKHRPYTPHLTLARQGRHGSTRLAALAIGTRSRAGSYGSFSYSHGLIVIRPAKE